MLFPDNQCTASIAQKHYVRLKVDREPADGMELMNALFCLSKFCKFDFAQRYWKRSVIRINDHACAHTDTDRHRHRHRHTDTDTDRHRQTDTDRETDGQTDRQRWTDRECSRERQRETHTPRHCHRE